MLILATESPTKRMIMDRSGLAYEAISANIDERAIEMQERPLSYWRVQKPRLLLSRTPATVLSLLIHSVFYPMVRACIKQKPLPKR